MNTDFCTSRTHRLLYSGYPLEITTFDDITEDVSTPAWYLHEEIEFQYILNGQVSITCGERCFTASRGDIVFVNQLAKHASVPAGSETAAVCSIIVHPSFILGANQPELEAKYLYPILSNSAYACLHIDQSAVLYPQFQSLISQLIALNATQSTGYELLSKSCILQLWKLIYDMLSDSSVTEYSIPSHSTNLDDQRVRQAILYIHKHFMEPVTLDKIADSILVSKSECCRCFKRAIGMSPFEYLMKYRIEESTRRMRMNPHESVSEIAGSVGFNNTSYYNKVFKKFMGCTPTEYRKSLKLPHKDYYTAEDFYKMPEDVRAELIDGQIYDMAAPDSLHQTISGELFFSIASYIKNKGGKCRIFSAPFDVQLNEKEDTVLEPDLTVICDRDKITRHGCVGAPDWIIEIVSPSNSRHDYITKLGLYSDAGVKEYWIVDAERQRISVYNFEKTGLIANVHTFDAPIKAGIYEDLTINFTELDLVL